MSFAANAEITSVLAAFYQQVSKHLCVGEPDLKVPPAVHNQGKSEAVIDILRHIL